MSLNHQCYDTCVALLLSADHELVLSCCCLCIWCVLCQAATCCQLATQPIGEQPASVVCPYCHGAQPGLQWPAAIFCWTHESWHVLLPCTAAMCCCHVLLATLLSIICECFQHQDLSWTGPRVKVAGSDLVVMYSLVLVV